jgi:hypothetical protein
MMRDNENNSIAVLVALLLMAVLGLAGLSGFVFLQRNRAMEQAMIAKQQAMIAEQQAMVAKDQEISAKVQSISEAQAATHQEKLLSSIAHEAQKSAIVHQELAERTRRDLELQIADLLSKLETTEAALRKERMQREAAEAAQKEALNATRQAIEARATAEALAAELAKVKQELAKANDKQ